MAKPTTGRIQQVPEPDPEQALVDTIMTAIYAGVGLIVAVIIYGTFGGVALMVSASSGRITAMITFGVALLAALGLIALLLRHFADRIRARSTNVYRGAWIGAGFALVVIVMLYYLPGIAFPGYCPPGGTCQ